MNSKEFIRNVFRTGNATNEDIARFMIKEYFLKGNTLNDFEEDLVLNYNHDERYSSALRNSFEDSLKEFINE